MEILTDLITKDIYNTQALDIIQFNSDERIPIINQYTIDTLITNTSKLGSFKQILIEIALLNYQRFLPRVLGDFQRLEKSLEINSVINLMLHYARYFEFKFNIQKADHIYKEDQKIKLVSQLTNLDTCIFTIIKDNREYIVKWCTNIEIELYNWKLCKDGLMITPDIEMGWFWWGYPILVMEKLEPLQKGKESITILSRDILEQLKIIHSFGVYTDIKPDNIMRKNEHYYLIDMESITTDKKYYGYCRKHFTPDFSSQYPEYGCITTYKNDLIEFGYTLNYILYPDDIKIMVKLDIDNEISYRDIDEQSPLFEYMEYVRNLDERIRDTQCYDILITKLITI